MATFFDLQKATLAARDRMANNTIGTRIRAGLVQVVMVHMERRRTVETPLSDFVLADRAVEILNGMHPA
jgi:hypothetical protein